MRRVRDQSMIPDVLAPGVVGEREVRDGDRRGAKGGGDGVVILMDVCMSLWAYNRGLLARHW